MEEVHQFKMEKKKAQSSCFDKGCTRSRYRGSQRFFTGTLTWTSSWNDALKQNGSASMISNIWDLTTPKTKKSWKGWIRNRQFETVHELCKTKQCSKIWQASRLRPTHGSVLQNVDLFKTVLHVLINIRRERCSSCKFVVLKFHFITLQGSNFTGLDTS